VIPAKTEKEKIMKNTAFSLMTALLAVMNESEPKDPYYVLAQYFLYHFDQLRDLNIYDVPAMCPAAASGGSASPSALTTFPT
jgi:hypothetical protein